MKPADIMRVAAGVLLAAVAVLLVWALAAGLGDAVARISVFDIPVVVLGMALFMVCALAPAIASLMGAYDFVMPAARKKEAGAGAGAGAPAAAAALAMCLALAVCAAVIPSLSGGDMGAVAGIALSGYGTMAVVGTVLAALALSASIAAGRLEDSGQERPEEA